MITDNGIFIIYSALHVCVSKGNGWVDPLQIHFYR